MKIHEIINRIRGNDPITLMMLKDITKKDVNELDYQTDAIILHSGNIHDVYIVKAFIQKGLNIKGLNNKGENALFTQQNPEVLQLLINEGLSVNQKAIHGQTALMTHADNIDKVKILVEAGADINAKTHYDSTVAFFITDTSVLDYLTERGLDLSVKNKSGETPLFKREIFTNPLLFKAFIDRGADINALAIHGKNTIMKHISLLNTNENGADALKILKIAVEKGLNIYHEDDYGNTLFKEIQSATVLRAIFDENELNLNRQKCDGQTLFENMDFKYIAQDLYLSGHLEESTLFSIPENRSVGDYLIKSFHSSFPEEAQKLIVLKEKLQIINSLHDNVLCEPELRHEHKKRL